MESYPKAAVERVMKVSQLIWAGTGITGALTLNASSVVHVVYSEEAPSIINWVELLDRPVAPLSVGHPRHHYCEGLEIPTIEHRVADLLGRYSTSAFRGFCVDLNRVRSDCHL